MKFLDKDISLQFTGLNPNQYYIYRVELFDYSEESYYDIFVGSAYTFSDTLDLDITEILANYTYSHPFTKVTSANQQSNFLISKVRVTLNNTTKEEEVALIYRYPNKNYEEYLNRAFIYSLPLLQGAVKDGDFYKLTVLPHVPSGITFPYIYFNPMEREESMQYYADKELIAQWDSYLGGNINTLETQGSLIEVSAPEWNTQKVVAYGVYGEALNEGIQPQEAESFLFHDMGLPQSECTRIMNGVLAGNPTLIKAYSTPAEASAAYQKCGAFFECYRDDITEQEKYYMPIAVVDDCPSRYYLMWQDRFGGIQCQGFSGRETYSESISTIQIQNYQGHRRNATHIVDPTYALNTKWLTEEEYPIYESLFTSPYLLLIDTELDKQYRVILVGEDYTEKTFRNQKQMLNLNIQVKVDKLQTIYS